MELDTIVRKFINTTNYTVNPITDGLINSTYILENNDNNKKYILQNINPQIFKNPTIIITNHLLINCLLQSHRYELVIIDPIASSTQEFLVHDENEQSWRLQNYIEDSKTFLKVPSSEIAYKAAKALSHFLDTVNTPDLIEIQETLPGFINFEKRIHDYKKSLEHANPILLENAQSEVKLANELLSLPNQWIEMVKKNHLPKRIIHADPKISNILFNKNNEPIAVIDLDTVIVSTILYDFGDMTRSYCNITNEDDGSSPINNFNPSIFKAVKEGFLFHLEEKLTAEEYNNLEYAAQVVIYIQAIRFLTDYLNENIYYSIQYPEHNLDRVRNQFRLLEGLTQYLKA
ncbi:aminoglycoside phosphotransferase family protein [Chryseobacterium nematophagum]|uniref:Aminoglycoside phosphotransferase family protein n=1 Tax=Chryseobacterium nematophagum TaxID=2305228 RepID=A0A3M7LDR5_9FLAO|nr:aminoglycoside phosphotransferase family protein [Chryseobacterium nematophagum]RMZ59642.1 aminoglycoside phosphotransferase family protein [Chryseobacterium nematophagum]